MIFFDMDGVLAKYTSVEELGSIDKLYEEGFFLNLPPIYSGIELLKSIAEYSDVGICSAVLTENENPYAAKEKLRWLEREVGEGYIDSIFFTPCCGRKAEFIATFKEGDILIDDQIDNLSDWKDKGGGIAIRFVDRIIPDVKWDGITLYSSQTAEEMMNTLMLLI